MKIGEKNLKKNENRKKKWGKNENRRKQIKIKVGKN